MGSSSSRVLLSNEKSDGLVLQRAHLLRRNAKVTVRTVIAIIGHKDIVLLQSGLEFPRLSRWNQLIARALNNHCGCTGGRDGKDGRGVLVKSAILLKSEIGRASCRERV